MRSSSSIILLHERILELERNLALAHNTVEALIEANATLRKELYEYKTYGMTLKEKLK